LTIRYRETFCAVLVCCLSLCRRSVTTLWPADVTAAVIAAVDKATGATPVERVQQRVSAAVSA
jgi:hypothetical protein